MCDKKTNHRHMGHKLGIINNQIVRYFANCWHKTGIEVTRMQCATMHYLRNHSNTEVFQKDLETEFSISGATATNILKLMEKEGLITREPLERDGRLKQLRLTEKGLDLDEKARNNVDRLEEAMKKGLTEEELTTFSDLLERVTQNIVNLMEEDNGEN